MAQQKGGAHKMKRSSHKKNYYAAQFHRTVENKTRRSRARARRLLEHVSQ